MSRVCLQVAAGMNVPLTIEIFAVAVGVVGESGVGQVGHHVEIVTETDVLYLPVYANILSLVLISSFYPVARLAGSHSPAFSVCSFAL